MGNTPTPNGTSASTTVKTKNIKAASPQPATNDNAVESAADTVGTEVLDQAKADLLKPVNASLDSLISTPSAQNFIGQGALLLASIAPLLPVLEGQAIRDIATALKSALNSTSSGSGSGSAV